MKHNYLFFLVLILFSPVLYGYEINGIVSSANGLVENIAGAEIYEQYGDEKPVAITDKDGKFKYDIKSDVPVILIARRKGFVDEVGIPEGQSSPIITKENEKDTVKFKLYRFFKQKNFEIYPIYKDKDCILNGKIQVGGICNDKTNEYKIDSLNEPKEGCEGDFVASNNKGGLVIPYLTCGMNFFYAQYYGGVVFLEENEENVYYYHVPEDAVKFENLNNKFKNEYDLGKSMGDYKYYKDADEFISENIKEFFKFCPKKLKEYEDYRKNNKPTKSSDDNDDKDSDKAVKEAQEKYDKAKEKEQSLANRTLGAVSMAATGIGGMELAQGLSEQRIDRESEQDMAAYIETFRCEYANGKSVKNGATNVELPADTLFDLYQEYIALAADVKAMKEQLDLAPGIESEVIIDKATAGLYDDKASEKANGTFASIYRAKMGNETDQAKLQEMSDTSGKRVKGGAIAAGAGALVGIVGDALINHVDWDKIKEKKNTSKENKDKIKTLKKGLAGAGLQNVDALDLSNFDFSSFDIDSIDFTKLSSKLKGKDAKELINTANKTSLLSSFSNLGLSFNN